VGFAAREMLVINSLGGWQPELVFVQATTWLTVLIVSREVWDFSKVRCGSEKQIVAVDGLLDMLLLPMNIVFFCAVCVRALKLQPTSHLAMMVPVVIESPDIYESFALWSVLELFVKVVQAEMANRDAEDRTSFESFKTISLSGVKLWVLIQTLTVCFKLVLEGLVAVYAPTLCNWVTKSCTGCDMWYREHLEMALAAVTFVLCSFAIMFVFYFEAGYRQHLHKTEPMFKFLGVKGIVSVTYFQWLTISALASPLGLHSTQIYLFHCLLYAFWMPLLAIFHRSLAYPYYSLALRGQTLSPWLVTWLRTLVVEKQSAARTVGASDRGVDRSSTLSNIAAAGEEGPRETLRDDASEGALDAPEENGAAFPDSETAPAESLVNQRTGSSRLLIYFVACAGCCCASIKAVLWCLPVDSGRPVPLRNITCTSEGDLAHFINTKGLHFTMPNDTAAQWMVPGVAGSWLPLCASTTVGCAPGHYTRHRLPSVSCQADGTYTWEGTCDFISCGMPPQLPHATPRMHDVERNNWTYGVTVHYDCEKPGFRGDLQVTCNVTGIWTVHGSCAEVTCGPPPHDMPHAKPLVDPSRAGANVSTGMIVRYQCDQMYNGTPTATCGNDGLYLEQGRCVKECGPPPMVPYACPSFDNAPASKGWFEGMQCPYKCDPGFQGFVTAVCGENGNYTVAGRCSPVNCGPPPRLPHATPRMDDVTRHNFTFGDVVHYDCDAPKFKGQLRAVCNVSSGWLFDGHCQEVMCGEPPKDIKHAKPSLDPKGGHMSVGSVVRYQCDIMYTGRPIATCGVNGMYIEEGRCRKECGPPPMVPHASPSFSNAMVSSGWVEGMVAKYVCEPGYEGSATAVCCENGNYTVTGGCSPVASVTTDRLYRNIHGLTAAIAVENALLVVLVGFFCWRARRPLARTPPLLLHSATNEFAVPASEASGIAVQAEGSERTE